MIIVLPSIIVSENYGGLAGIRCEQQTDGTVHTSINSTTLEVMLHSE
jgi:hypothetical protein